MAKELELAYPHTLDSPLKRTARLPSVDILRGIAMVVMALDHTRDWFSNSAALFDPLDLSRTTPELFFTRWITHFCVRFLSSWPVLVLICLESRAEPNRACEIPRNSRAVVHRS